MSIKFWSLNSICLVIKEAIKVYAERDLMRVVNFRWGETPANKTDELRQYTKHLVLHSKHSTFFQLGLLTWNLHNLLVYLPDISALTVYIEGKHTWSCLQAEDLCSIAVLVHLLVALHFFLREWRGSESREKGLKKSKEFGACILYLRIISSWRCRAPYFNLNFEII